MWHEIFRSFVLNHVACNAHFAALKMKRNAYGGNTKANLMLEKELQREKKTHYFVSSCLITWVLLVWVFLCEVDTSSILLRPHGVKFRYKFPAFSTFSNFAEKEYRCGQNKEKRISGSEPFYCISRYFVVLWNIGWMTFRFTNQFPFIILFKIWEELNVYYMM